MGEVGLKRRYGAMSTGELLYEQQCLLAVALLLVVSIDDADNPEEAEDLEIAAALLADVVVKARMDLTVIRSVRGRSLMIDDIDANGAWGDFRFRKGDIRRLLVVLDFPPVWVCKNKSRFPGETAHLLLLRRLRYVFSSVHRNEVAYARDITLLVKSCTRSK